MITTHSHHHRSGLSLVETAIVLVVIGLVIGGVVVGRELLAAAGVRATVAQVQKYNAAVANFTTKYKALPGDMNSRTATQYGFIARGSNAGQGDGNGVIQGYTGVAADGIAQGEGETATFWVDLSKAGMIDSGFSLASETAPAGGGGSNLPSAQYPISSVLPPAKMGDGNYIYIYSQNGANYWGLSVISGIQTADLQQMLSTPGMTVYQANAIDTKLDDGLPQSGEITATYANSSGVQWAAGGGVTAENETFNPINAVLGISSAEASGGGGGAAFGTPDQSPTVPSTITCYDNGGVSGTQKYSVGQRNAGNNNCALSFKAVN